MIVSYMYYLCLPITSTIIHYIGMPARNGFIYHSYEIIASKDIINCKKKKDQGCHNRIWNFNFLEFWYGRYDTLIKDNIGNKMEILETNKVNRRLCIWKNYLYKSACTIKYICWSIGLCGYVEKSIFHW